MTRLPTLHNGLLSSADKPETFFHPHWTNGAPNQFEKATPPIAAPDNRSAKTDWRFRWGYDIAAPPAWMIRCFAIWCGIKRLDPPSSILLYQPTRYQSNKNHITGLHDFERHRTPDYNMADCTCTSCPNCAGNCGSSCTCKDCTH